jgi:ornithine cyclodeaminase
MMLLVTMDDLRDLIHQVGLKTFFGLLIDELRNDMGCWDSFKKSPRHVTHYQHGVMELMPSATDEYYAYKFVNGHPGNPSQGRFTVVATGMLADVATGYPLMISEMTLLTALRTAATSALASTYLSRSDASTMAIIGTGAQSEFQVLAHHFCSAIDTVRYFDTDDRAMDKFAGHLSAYPLHLQRCQSVEEAVEHVDLVTTATAAKCEADILTRSLLQPGVHINAIGGDCFNKTELNPALLEDCKIVVEYLPQTQQEGEIQHLDGLIHAELWEIVQSKKPGRESDQEITLFDSVGFALEDYSVLKLVYRLMQQYQLGGQVALVPEAKVDPKNLFSLML